MLQVLTLCRNKRLSKGKKGIKKRTVDPFTRKDEYSVKVWASFIELKAIIY